MATTLPWKAEAPRVALCACALLSGPGVWAQTQARGLELGLSSQLTWTSNSNFGQGAGESDTSIELRPTLRLRSEGARVKLNGSVAVSAIDYLNGTQKRRLDPSADLAGRAELLEKFLFVEAGYRATQTSASVFGARPETGATGNALTTSQWRLSPVIEGRAGSGMSYQLRSDNTWTREIGPAVADAGAGGYFVRHSGFVEQAPRPLGWRLEAERAVTRYDDPLQDDVTVQVARALVNYAPAETWSLGLRFGRERDSELIGGEKSRSIYGLQTSWRPTLRTSLSAFAERRSFGTGWNLAFDHRRPQMAWSVAMTRGLDTTPQSLFDLPATDNVLGLLDAMFTTRYPDPAERARAVQEFVTQRGLPTSTNAPVSLFAKRFSIATSRRVSVSWIGSRSTFTLSAFGTRTEDALDAGPLATGDPTTNNRQSGVSAALSHRLTALTSLTVGADWSRIRALATDERTAERSLRVQVATQVGPTTSAVAGARYRRLQSNVATDGNEGSVFMGLDHRF